MMRPRLGRRVYYSEGSQVPSAGTGCDSTVSGIEGIDWLALRRGPDVAQRVLELTRRAMEGELALEDVYGSRLSEIRPRRDDVEALADAYLERMAPGVPESVARIRQAGVRVTLVSGGLRPALLPLASHLGLSPSDLHAVSIEFECGRRVRGV